MHARAALQHTSSSKFVIVDLRRERQSSWVARDPGKLQIVQVCRTRPPTRVVVPHEVYCARSSCSRESTVHARAALQHTSSKKINVICDHGNEKVHE